MRRLWIIPVLFLCLVSCTDSGTEKISILETTDLHGVFLPYDFIERRDAEVSLASVATYLRQLRQSEGEIVLLDNGDNLQGQPLVYYYNFIDTLSPHINSLIMNYLKYDAVSVGNHDIEAGHDVYDRLIREYDFPLLAANAVKTTTGEPYFKPYAIINKKGLRIAVLGMITPAVPTWLPPELYEGMEFRDMLETAREWMPVIQKEKPDIVVGLFHSGWRWEENGQESDSYMDENGSAAIAREVPGFDIIFTGHDHNPENTKIVNEAGDTVLILNAGSRAEYIGRADVEISGKGKGQKVIKGELVRVRDLKPDPEFVSKFSEQREEVEEYVNKKIAVSSSDISSRDSYFGPSAFVDMIHSLQLRISGADISFAAPLSFDVTINSGPVTVSDMFKLYRFENMLYTMEMTGEEIVKYLEYSYGAWYNTMTGPGDYLLKFRKGRDGKPAIENGKAWLSEQPYNFDSAAGIDYVVDVSKPEGSRIRILSVSGGEPFDLKKRYKVALNSYRGNGGGGHLAGGAGFSPEEMTERLLRSTERDLRFYILEEIERKGTIVPEVIGNWSIEPSAWVKGAAARDYRLLFN